MATNAQVAYQAAATKLELLRDADLEPRAEAFYDWLQTRTTNSEVQTVTEGGSGLTSFVLHYAGQDTAAIDDQATAAQVQAALEALSNLAVGDVVVDGDPGGPYTVAFGGTLAGTNVAEMTATPTGGTGTVDVATTTVGGSAVAAVDISNAQAALLSASAAWVAHASTDPIGDVLAAADNILDNIAAHAAGHGTP